MLNKNEVDEVLRCIYICQENYGKGNEYLQSAISKLELRSIGVDNMNAEGKMQCKDCGNLGEKVECGQCVGGFGWVCKADKHGQHVNPEMGACVDFVDLKAVKKYTQKDWEELQNEANKWSHLYSGQIKKNKALIQENNELRTNIILLEGLIETAKLQEESS